MHTTHIVAVEWAALEGQRPRTAGSNARLGAHGIGVRVPILRITTNDGTSGFGACHAPRDQLDGLLGKSLDDLFASDQGVRAPWLAYEYPIWDLVGQRMGVPVYMLTATIAGTAVQEPFHAPCYDTSLYFDDLHLASDQAAARMASAIM